MSATQEYISLGYVLATPRTFEAWRPFGVPNPFYTPSPCISDLVPNGNVLDWLTGIQSFERLRLNREQEYALMQHMEELFVAQLWGLEGVFLQIGDARTVAKKWLGNVPAFKLLGMALPKRWIAELLKDVTEDLPSEYAKLPLTAGTYQAARRPRQPAENGTVLGYEVVGLSYYSDLHTSACVGGVREKLMAELGVSFTPSGFLQTLEQAEVAARAYMFEEDGAGMENCRWYPVQVLEYPLRRG